MKKQILFILVGFVLFSGTKVFGQAFSDQCPVTIYMYDGYGDGWNGNALSLYWGDSLLTTVTISDGSYDEAIVYLPSDSVRLFWTQGSWSEECSFVIESADGVTLYTSPSGMGDYWVFFASFENGCPRCYRPYNLHLLSRTSDQIVVGWDAADSTTWLVEYGMYGFVRGEGIAYATTDNNLTLNGLMPYTSYQVYVARICDGDTSQWTSGVYATLCDTVACTYNVRLVDGYYGSFLGGRILICDADGGVVDTVQYPSGWYSDYYDYSLQACPGQLLLRYESTINDPYYYALQSRYIVLTDAEGDTVSYSDGYNAYYAGGYYDTIDYTCPTCLSVGYLTVAAYDSNSAVITWHGTGTQYIVSYGRSVDDFSSYVQMTTSDTVLTLTGLEAGTSYTVRVRSLCGLDDSSHVRVLNFSTAPHSYIHIYVEASATGDNNGTSWNDAFVSLSDALATAYACYGHYGTRPDIWVASGTYYGGNTGESENAFTMMPGINVYGGFVGTEPSGFDLSQRDIAANPTILDGEGLLRVLGQYEYFYGDDTAQWNGFVIRNGYGGYGGGVYLCQGGTLRNCVVENNVSTNYGGGIYSDYGNVEGCTLRNNTATSGYGGGVRAQGGRILSCVVVGDSARYYGGVYLSGTLMENTLVYGNSSYYAPAGVYSSSSYTTIAGCDIVNNRSHYSGSSSAIGLQGGGQMTNSVVWGNYRPTDGNRLQVGGSGYVTNCAIEGGYGSGNINLAEQNMGEVSGMVYPMFVQPEDGDFRLTAESPLVDAGVSYVYYGGTDLGGNLRHYGDSTDIGCYEYNGEAYCIRPIGISVTSSATAAVVSWQTPRYAQSVELDYRMVDDSLWTTVSAISGDYYLLDGLTSSQIYEARVRSYCGNDSYSNYSDVVVFSTPSATTEEFSYTLDSVYRTSVGAGGNIWWAIKIPAEELTAGNRLENVRLYVRDNGSYTLTIYEDGLSAPQTSIYSSSYTFTGEEGWYNCPLSAPITVDDTKPLWIVFSNSGIDYPATATSYMGNPNSDWCSTNGTSWSHLTEYSLYYSWLIAAEFGGLGDSQCPLPLLTVGNVTDSSALVVCQTSVGLGVELQYKDAGDSAYISLPAMQEQTLTGLRHNTTYSVRIRAICGNDSTTLWRTISFTTPPVLQQHYYVSPTPSGLADGTSWDNATDDLEWAQSAAEAAYTLYGAAPSVWVSQGTYYGGFRTHSAVKVYGGFVGNESADYNLSLRDFTAHPTILDGQYSQRVLLGGSGYTEATSVVWDGFTMQRGTIPYNYYGSGAAIFANTTLSNCIITDCRDGYGAVRLNSGGRLVGCTVCNDSSYYHGAVSMYSAVMENCLVCNNTSYSDVSGVYFDGYGTVTGSTIVNNLALNYENGDGGYSVGGSGYVYNSIVWGSQGQSVSGDVNMAYCAVEGGLVSGSLNIPLASTNEGAVFSPRFVQPSSGTGWNYNGGDWHLQEGSICINRGDNGLATDTTDLDNNSRIQNDTIDMGCYESMYGSASLPEHDSVIYVKTMVSGYGDGTSWDNATADINQAVQIARLLGVHKVWVAAGTYYGDVNTTDNSAFILADGVSIYGGFVGDEPSDYDITLRDIATNATILDGQNLRRVVYQDEDFESVTTLDGLTITHGYITSGQGAGLRLQGNIRLENCTVSNNTVSSNWDYTYGAGIYAYANYSDRPIVIDHCTIRDNGTVTGSYLYGGAIYMGNTTLNNCVITGNQSYYRPVYSYSGTNHIDNCLIYNNTSQYQSGIYNYYADLTVNNSDIVANNSIQESAPIYSYYNGYVTLNNTVVWGNTANGERSYFIDYGFTLHNCAFDGMTDSISTCIALADSNDGSTEGIHYPRFASPAEGDFSLMTGSALIDAGDSSYVATSVDIEGNPRVSFEQVDIGCYENNAVENCPRVIHLTVSSAGYNSAYINFQHSGDDVPSAYQIELRTPGMGWYLYGSTTREHLFLTNLDTNQQYEVRVRSVCDDTLLGLYSRTVSFRTRNQANCVPLIVGMEETADGGWCLPTNTCYNQSYTQQLFTSEEMVAEARVIDTIGFQYVYPYADTRVIDIYMAHTTESSLSSFLPSTGFELVYSGSVNFNNSGTGYWCNIPLQTSFAYNGTDNLLVVMVDHTGSHTYCDDGLFLTHSTDAMMSAYVFANNSTAYNPSTPPSATISSYRTNTRFSGMCSSGNIACPMPNMVVRNVTSSSAVVEWVANSQYDLQIRNLTTNGEFETLTISNGDTLAGLAQGTTYQIRMRNVCQEMPYVSDWNSVRFTTLASGSPIVYVAQQAAGIGDGSSWSNATDDINFAQSVAAARATLYGTPATVWVATGTYHGDTMAENAFVAIEGVNVYGGFAGVEPENYDISQRDCATNPTVLEGGNARRVLYQQSLFTIRTTWDGFTLINGFLSSTGSSTYGHGAYLRGGFTLSHCIVRDNATIYDGAYHYGGGIYVVDAGSSNGVIIDHCDISGNGDSYNNGNYTYGSAIYTGSYTSIINSRLHDNISRQGALYAYSGTTYVHNTLIDHNHSCYSGAGVYVQYASTYLENTTVANNSISNNNSYPGGGIYCYNSTYMNLLNTVVWGNHGTSSSETDNISGHNVSYIANSAVEGLSEASVMNLASSNFGEDPSLNYPAFVNPEIGDYRLYELSALIDGGTATGYQAAPYTPDAMLVYDLSDLARTYGTSTDIGCYEYHGEDYCLTPANLSVSQVMNNSAYLAYDSRDGEQPMLYEIDIKADSGVWTPFTATQRTRLFLTGLNPLTDYAVRVRAVCDSLGNTSPYVYATFRTTDMQEECVSLTITDNQQTTTSGAVLPTNTYYCYSYTQQVYTADELGYTPRQIDTISFQYHYSYSDTRNIELYLAHTTVNTLSGHQASSDFQLVYSGTYTFSNTGDEYWNPIVLQTPFDYNGTDNLLVVMVDNTGTYNYSGSKFYTHATPNDVKAVYNYRDGSPYNILSPPSASTTSYRNNIRLGRSCGGSSSTTCGRPNIGISELNTHSAKVDLLVSSNYELQLRKVGEPDFTTVTLGADSTVYNLEQNTRYQMKVRNICSIGDTSGWSSVFFATPPSSSPIVYVAQQATGLGDGSSWENAMSDINRAMDHAVAHGNVYGNPSQVWVATGVYYGDTSYSNNAFTMRSGVSVYGGFAGNEPESFDLTQRNPSSHPTILSGLNQRRVLYQPSSFDASTAVVWDGFTVQQGQTSDNGAGVYLRAYSTLRNCIVKYNNSTSSYYGGGIYASGTSYGYYDSDYNYHTDYSTSIENCEITNNRAAYGGGVYLYYTNVVNCLVANNTASSYGGGISSSNANIRNTTIVANAANEYGGVYSSSSYPTLANCIVWGNTVTSGRQLIRVNISYSAVEDAASDTTMIALSSNNVGSFNSPRFVAPTVGIGYQYYGGNWQLADSSICIGRGSNAYVTISADIAGNARIQQGRVDMGCYESPYSQIRMPTYADSIVYVTESGAGLMDGTSWQNAMSDLQNAINTASMCHGRVWVATGTYYGNPNNTNAFIPADGVDVYGGFAGNEPVGYDLSQRDLSTHATILDGQDLQRVLYQPTYFNNMAVWDGLVLQNGRLTSGNGAGAYIYGNIHIANCIVRNNTTSGYGAGIYKSSDYNYLLNITNTQILDNTASNSSSYGGGLYAYYATVTNCRISGNSAGYGAGVRSSGGCSFYNCIIDHNTANTYPGYGAIYVAGSNSYFENCDIVNNTCTYSTTSGTGGVYSYSSYGTFNNCIIWGNKRGYSVNNLSGTPSITSSAIEGGYTSGTDIIDLAASNDGTDPAFYYVRFIDPDNGDYHLHATSSLIDAGDSTLVSQPYDYDGNTRIYGGTVDLGAFESSEVSSCPPVVGLQVDSVTSFSAKLSWHPATGLRYLVEYGIHGSSSHDTTSTTDTSITLTGLALNRYYSARVRVICDTGSTSLYSIPVNFNTVCDTTLITPLSDFTTLSPADSDIVYQQNVTFSWAAIAEADSYDFYIWADGTTEPSTPTQAGLVSTTVTYRIPYFDNNRGQIYHWRVVARKECINKSSAVNHIQVAYLPDLHVSGFTTSTPVAGNAMTIQWTVVNDGQGSTPPGATWYDYIWLTSEFGIGGNQTAGDETLLASIPNLQSLAPGESYTNSIQINLPTGSEGDYFLFVLANQYQTNSIDLTPTGGTTIPDPYTPNISGIPYPYLHSSSAGNYSIPESMVNDNFFYKLLTILPQPTPDLQVVSVTHPLNAFSGDNITVSWQVSNQGGAATALTEWVDAVYLSAEPTFTYTSATLLGTAQHSGGLAIGEFYNGTLSGAIPIQFSGTYYVYVKTDISDAVYESIFEGNNTTASSQTINIVMSPPADLAIDSILFLYDTVSTRGQYTIQYRISNVGARAVTDQSWRDAVYLSANSTFAPNTAIKIGNRLNNVTLGIGESIVVTQNITIPDAINGIRYLFVRTDINDDIFEYIFEDNNIGMREMPISVCPPDLEVSWLTVPDTINPNQPFLVRWRVQNTGFGNIWSRTITDNVTYNGTTIYTSSQNTSLAAGQYIDKQAWIQIPCVSILTGQLKVYTDPNAIIYEANETNNASSGIVPVVIAPDLSVSSLQIADTLWSGTTVPVSWTLTNSGTAPVDAEVTDGFYLGDNTVFATTTSLSKYSRHVTLGAGESIEESTMLTLPNGIAGTYYIHQQTNEGSTTAPALCEGANTASNTARTSGRTVMLSPYADLRVMQIVTDDTVNIGQSLIVDYTVKNQGTGILENINVNTTFYLSAATVLNTSYATQIGSDIQRMTLAVDAMETYSAILRVPTSLSSGNYYIYAVTDADDTVYEYTGESNNTTRGERVNVKVYPLDLSITALQGNTSVEWGHTYTYTLTVNNNSQVPTLTNYWYDRLYLSSDNVLQDADRQVGSVYHNGQVAGGGSYNVTYTVTIPYGAPSTCYLIAVADDNNANPDINATNNMLVQALNVNSVPTPDLAISDIQIVEPSVVSGQLAHIAYTVTNVGTVDVVAQSWTDKLFLSANSTYESGDVEVGTVTQRNMTLLAGASYTDTMEFRVSLPQHGSFYFIGRANSNNGFFEDNTSNNVGLTMATVSLPLPGDLVVSQVTHEDSIFSGDIIHISWSVNNVGENTLSGNGLRSLAYLSADTVFDVNDRLLGNVNRDNVMLPPGGNLSQSFSCRLSGLREGDYYVIVKTDVTNAFNEVNDTNNNMLSEYPVALTVRNLPFNTPTADTLYNNVSSDFKLVVGDKRGETVRIHLDSEDSLSGAVNMLYVSHNNIGNNLNYTYSTIGQFTHSPELYIPSTEDGYYGINAIGSTPVGGSQAVTLSADILPFELREVSPNVGGNNGMVTVELTGSRFRPDMRVWMRHDSSTVIIPDTVIYDSYYRAFATFDLDDKDTGVYSMGVLNYCEGEAILDNAFTIKEGSAENLSTNLILPQTPRPNRIVVLMLEFGNIGTTDITAPVVELESMGRSYISLTSEGLTDHQTTLRIPLQVENDVPYLIRPGARGSVTIFCYTSGNMAFSVKRVQ